MPTIHDTSPRSHTVLVAVDDSPASGSAIRTAHALATLRGATVHVLHVLDDRSSPIPPPLDLAIGLADATAGRSVHAQQEAELHDRLVALLGSNVDWSRSVKLGNPATTIAKHATELGATLIAMGLRRHNPVERALRDETTLNTIRVSPCPVLAVSTDAPPLPEQVVAALDFSPMSMEAARAARTVMGSAGHIQLTYVPPALRYRAGEGEGIIHQLGVEKGFEELATELATGGVKVDHVVLHHDVKERTAELLLEHAESTQADLISAGSVGRSLIDRWLMGSVSTDLVRDGRVSMLIAPAHEVRADAKR